MKTAATTIRPTSWPLESSAPSTSPIPADRPALGGGEQPVLAPPPLAQQPPGETAEHDHRAEDDERVEDDDPLEPEEPGGRAQQPAEAAGLVVAMRGHDRVLVRGERERDVGRRSLGERAAARRPQQLDRVLRVLELDLDVHPLRRRQRPALERLLVDGDRTP